MENLSRVAAAVVLGLSAIFSSACASFISHSGPEYVEHMPEQVNPRLYASFATKEKLGWIADRLPHWAGMNVIAVHADDMKGVKEEEFFRMTDFLKFHQASEDAQYKYKKIWFKSLSRQEVASATLTSDEAFYCFIMIPDKIPVKEEISEMTRIPVDYISNLEGTPEEVVFQKMAHEAAHCRQIKDPDNHFPMEVDADRGMLRIYFEELAAGRVVTKSMPRTSLLARGLYPFATMDFTHATAPWLAPTVASRGSDTGKTEIISSQYSLQFLEPLIENHPFQHGRKRDFNTLYLWQPRILLHIMKDFQTRNIFPERSLEKIYVDQFIEAAETLAPAYFRLAAP